MGKLEFANIPVKRWIIDLDGHDHLDNHSGYVCPPATYEVRTLKELREN